MPSVHIQLQNVESWLPLKFIFNSRPSPSLASTTSQNWPLTSDMLRTCFRSELACREEPAGWTPSHPHADLWAPVFSESFFGFWVVWELHPDERTVYTLLAQAHSLIQSAHFISCPRHTLLAIVLTHKHKHHTVLHLVPPLQPRFRFYQGSPHSPILREIAWRKMCVWLHYDVSTTSHIPYGLIFLSLLPLVFMPGAGWVKQDSWSLCISCLQVK